MTRCESCAGALRQTRGNHRYVEAGLPHVILVNTVLLQCTTCALTIAVLPDTRLLAVAVATKLLLLRATLSGGSIRYLRKAMKMTADELAFLLGTTRVQVSRWENNHARMGGMTELRFRLEVADKLVPPETEQCRSMKDEIVRILTDTQPRAEHDGADVFVDAGEHYLRPFELPPIEAPTGANRT